MKYVNLLLTVPFIAMTLATTTGCDPRYGLTDDQESCLRCHSGIEQAHGSIEAGRCTICHGGNGEGFEIETGHVPVPGNWAQIRGNGLPPAPNGFIKDFAPDQLAAMDPAYVRFINPGDIRAMDQSCGDCHADEVRTMRNSVMTTNAGHYFPTLMLAGIQDDSIARYGSFAVTDDDCDLSIPGSTCGVGPLVPNSAAEITAAIEADDKAALTEIAYNHYLAKNCNTCHQAGYPRNNSPGLYRSSGCTACHMVYSDRGIYEGGDETIPKGTPTHAIKHELTTKIPSKQCAHCHFQGGRIGLLYRGIREGGFNAAKTPPNAVPIQETLYGHSPGYYFDDEDSTNDIDETPPDIHFERGMHCADCHTGSDVHGTDRIFSSSKQQVDITCEDCHGTIRDAVVPDANGDFRTGSGRILKQLSLAENGDVILKGIVDGVEHFVSQPVKMLAPGGGASDLMHQAMGEDATGFSHTEALSCDTCHTSYNLYCIGCHVSFDLRLSQVDYQTGGVTPGLTRGSREFFSLDSLLLGTRLDGRVQTVSPSQQVNMTIVGSSRYGAVDGELLLGTKIDVDGVERTIGEFREGPTGESNNGFTPFFQHTTSRGARTCASCHRQDNTEAERIRVRGVYGFGTGEFMLEDGAGGQIDGLRFLDDTGAQTTTWIHPGTGPVRPVVMERALSVVLDELP